ncbi:MAG: hypothetical protein SNH01_05790 [Rikenellaceae bacterium]
MKNIQLLLAAILLSVQYSSAQIVLIGDNSPFEMVNDGDFEQIRASWRKGIIPPFWRMSSDFKPEFKGDKTFGVDFGRMYSSCNIAVADSKLLNTNQEYQQPCEGDIIHWSFGADVEYNIKASVTLALVFGDREQIVADQEPLIGADLTLERFSGAYVVSKEDAALGLPFLRLYMRSKGGVKIFVDDVRVWVEVESKRAPALNAVASNQNIELIWSDAKAQQNDKFAIYRKGENDKKYQFIGECVDRKFVDKGVVSGVNMSYTVVRIMDGGIRSGASNIVTIATTDNTAPSAPIGVKCESLDSEIALSWNKNRERDVESYSILRKSGGETEYKEIISGLKATKFEDIIPLKGVGNSYQIVAHDYSGNQSKPSQPITARVKLVDGASFSDLILPMPVRSKLRNDLWGANGVIPRDADNGIESPDWSYWGGRPVKCEDGKYRMNVTRWREDAIKGHWEWPSSTVAYTESDNPIGPYKVVREFAYDYMDGYGHNPDIILMNDGSYAFYSLIHWKPMIFTSKSMEGPWTLLGELKVEGVDISDPKNSTYFRNLSGVQREDGSIIIVTKIGRIIKSDKGLLGPYDIVNDKTIQQNETIPKRYRFSGYEDPVMWKDEVQFHMMINAQVAKRAIYLRSKDGIGWQYNPGLAYTPAFTNYENGKVESWDKMERPHVITDEYGRATHLSLAVVDVPKEHDYGSDNHNSKNIIIPLRVSKRIEILNKERIGGQTKEISLLIRSEDGFNALKDVDVASLRFGAPIEVDYGRGCRAVNSRRKGRDLIVSFSGGDYGITADDFVCKMIGKDNKGNMIFGYAKLNKTIKR